MVFVYGSTIITSTSTLYSCFCPLHRLNEGSKFVHYTKRCGKCFLQWKCSTSIYLDSSAVFASQYAHSECELWRRACLIYGLFQTDSPVLVNSVVRDEVPSYGSSNKPGAIKTPRRDAHACWRRGPIPGIAEASGAGLRGTRRSVSPCVSSHRSTSSSRGLGTKMMLVVSPWWVPTAIPPNGLAILTVPPGAENGAPRAADAQKSLSSP